MGAFQARDAADGVALDLDERERTRGGIAAEDGERVVELPRDVDLLAVGAHRHAVCAVQPCHVSGAVHLGSAEPEVDGFGRGGGAEKHSGEQPSCDRRTEGSPCHSYYLS